MAASSVSRSSSAPVAVSCMHQSSTRGPASGAARGKVPGGVSGCSPLWPARPGVNLVRMNGRAEPTRLGLEVRFDAKPIQGRLYDQGDHARLDRPFSGWLGLMAALEAARGAEPRVPREQIGEAR